MNYKTECGTILMQHPFRKERVIISISPCGKCTIKIGALEGHFQSRRDMDNELLNNPVYKNWMVRQEPLPFNFKDRWLV